MVEEVVLRPSRGSVVEEVVLRPSRGSVVEEVVLRPSRGSVVEEVVLRPSRNHQAQAPNPPRACPEKLFKRSLQIPCGQGLLGRLTVGGHCLTGSHDSHPAARARHRGDHRGRAGRAAGVRPLPTRRRRTAPKPSSWPPRHAGPRCTPATGPSPRPTGPTSAVNGPCPSPAPGTPDIAEFGIAEFALAIGLSTDAGRRYLGDALELHHRLHPRLTPASRPATLPAWRARRIAAATRALPAEAADFVDRHVAPVAHRIGLTALDRLIDEALTRFDPEAAEAKAAEAPRPGAVSTSTYTTCTTTGPSTSAASWTCPTPSTSTTSWTRGAAQLKADGLHRHRSAYAAPRPSACWPAASSPPTTHRSSAADQPCTCTPPTRPWQSGSGLVRVEETRSFVAIDRLAELVRRPRHPDRRHTRPRPRPATSTSTPTRSPTGSAPRPRLRNHDMRVPRLHPPRPRCDHDHITAHAAGRRHLHLQHRTPVPQPPPPQNPRRLDLHQARPRHLPVDKPPRLHLPTRPPRHPRPHRARSIRPIPARQRVPALTPVRRTPARIAAPTDRLGDHRWPIISPRR